MSEHFGRRTITQVTFAFFLVWTLAAALSPNWPALLIFRFLAGMVGSSPVALVTGILADIYNNPTSRGAAMSLFMAVSCPGFYSLAILTMSTDNLFRSSLCAHRLRLLLNFHWLALVSHIPSSGLTVSMGSISWLVCSPKIL